MNVIKYLILSGQDLPFPLDVASLALHGEVGAPRGIHYARRCDLAFLEGKFAACVVLESPAESDAATPCAVCVLNTPHRKSNDILSLLGRGSH